VKDCNPSGKYMMISNKREFLVL